MTDIDRLTGLSDDDKLSILDDPAHEDHASLLDLLDPESALNAPSPEAPYGYMIDPVTQERRPKKRPGRRRVPDQATPESPESPESPDASPAEPSAPFEREPDRAPSSPTSRRRSRGGRRGSPSAPLITPDPPSPVAPFRAGPIAKGMNKLYRRAGKLIGLANPLVGQAFVDITRKEDEEDVTVGEAWEELARTNPRIRASLNKLLTGSGWGQLIMCHMPILLAVAIQTGILERLPMGNLLAAFAPDEDSETSEDFNPFAGLTEEDMAQAAALAAQMMPGTVPPPFSRGA